MAEIPLQAAAVNDLERQLETVLHAAWTHDDSAHDISHIKRVRKTALAIADSESPAPDRDVLLAAVWLHDLVIIEKNDPRRPQASRLAADEASRLLAGLGWSESNRAAVAHTIAAHSFSAGIPPETLEARILRDADRIDAIGAIGIARCFAVGGRMGTSLYDADDPSAQHRPLNDRMYSLDHFWTKLLKLGEGMLTAEGKRIAAERIAFTRGYVEQFLREVG